MPVTNHYFICFMVSDQVDAGGNYIWNPAQGVINRHPFAFIRDEKQKHLPNGTILVAYQRISEEDYFLYETIFNHSK